MHDVPTALPDQGAPKRKRDLSLPARQFIPWESAPRASIPEPLVRNILVPIDFSKASMKALERAVALANQCNATLTIFHVIDVNAQAQAEDAKDLMPRLWDAGWKQMGHLARSVCGRAEAQTVIEQGLPWENIVEKSRQFDLMILSKSRGKRAPRLFSKHTAERVINNANCAVMVVYEPD